MLRAKLCLLLGIPAGERAFAPCKSNVSGRTTRIPSAYAATGSLAARAVRELVEGALRVVTPRRS